MRRKIILIELISHLVDGNWSDWEDWSDCPVTCGGGVQERTRTCTNPPAQFGGAPCPGESEESRACNEAPCPSNFFYIFVKSTNCLKYPHYIVLHNQTMQMLVDLIFL